MDFTPQVRRSSFKPTRRGRVASGPQAWAIDIANIVTSEPDTWFAVASAADAIDSISESTRETKTRSAVLRSREDRLAAFAGNVRSALRKVREDILPNGKFDVSSTMEDGVVVRYTPDSEYTKRNRSAAVALESDDKPFDYTAQDDEDDEDWYDENDGDDE